MTETTDTTGDTATGAAELQRHRNPFYTPLGLGLTVTVAAIAIAFFAYSLTVGALSIQLARAIEAADTPLQVLMESAPYTQSLRDLAATDGAVDDLAIATWIRHYKLAAPGTDLGSILDDPRFNLLRAAIRYGSHCPVATGTLERLQMTTVRRIVALAQFLGGSDCATVNGNDPQTASEALVVRNIAGLQPLGELRSDTQQLVGVRCSVGHPVQLGNVEAPGGIEAAVGCVDIFNSVPQLSGKALFRILLDRVGAFDGLETAPIQRQAAYRAELGGADDKVTAATANRDAAETLRANVETGADTSITIDQATADRDERQRELDVATAARDKLAATPPNDEIQQQDAARQILYTLNTSRLGATELSLDDPQIQAIEDYAVALMASVDTDAAVSSARQLLAAARGIEQFLIVALFLVVGALMLERFVAFIGIGRRVDRAVSLLRTLKDPSLPARGPAEVKALREDQVVIAQARRAAIGGLALHGVEDDHRRLSELLDDMLRAIRADLLQISLYGLSDEHTERVADVLKQKLDSSRQIIEWGITTLPALGFLGTVHGILDALNGVSGLTQGDAASRLATLLDVSGALGLAFSTTLIALVGMIILSYFDVLQERSEKAIVDEFRDFLSDRFLS